MKEQEIANEIGNQLAQFMSSLCYRWRDEKEYENFADYQKAVAKKFEQFPNAKFIKLSKKPFEVVFTVNETQWSLRVNSKSVGLFARNMLLPKGNLTAEMFIKDLEKRNLLWHFDDPIDDLPISDELKKELTEKLKEVGGAKAMWDYLEKSGNTATL